MTAELRAADIGPRRLLENGARRYALLAGTPREGGRSSTTNGGSMFTLTRKVSVLMASMALAVGAAACGEDEEPLEGESVEEVAPEEGVVEEEE